MTNLKILTTPNPTLRAKAKRVSKLDKKVLNLIYGMEKVLKKSKIPGAGLSATQVGVPLKIFVAGISPIAGSEKQFAINNKLMVFINPQITWSSKNLNTDVVPKENLLLEGCLSVPKIYALIKRFWTIEVKYQTIWNLKFDNWSLRERSERFQGLNATLIQHEIDHLNGILFTDRALAQGAQIYEVGEDKGLQPIVL